MDNKVCDFEVLASYNSGRIERRAVMKATTCEEAAVQAIVTRALPLDVRGGLVFWNREIQRLSNKEIPEVVFSGNDEVILAWGDDNNAQTLLLVVREIASAIE